MRPLSRRTLLAVIPLALRAERKESYQIFASDRRRYVDGATEFEVVRLTHPNHYSAFLPARAVPRKSDSVFYVSDRHNQTWQVFRADVKSGVSGRMTDASRLDPQSVALLTDDRTVVYVDGDTILSDNGGRAHELVRMNSGAKLVGRPAPSEDSTLLFWGEGDDAGGTLRMQRLPKGSLAMVTEVKGRIIDPLPNPRRATVMWRREDGSLWVCAYDGSGVRKVNAPAGKVLQAHWSPDGQSLLYLFAYDDTTKLNALREQDLDSQKDRAVANTSQFVAFDPNANATVFVGASRNKAAANVLLLLRVTRREFTLCEHRSAEPQSVCPQFAPNSQRVFFQSEKDGKPAIYTMSIDKLVEKTES